MWDRTSGGGGGAGVTGYHFVELKNFSVYDSKFPIMCVGASYSLAYNCVCHIQQNNIQTMEIWNDCFIISFAVLRSSRSGRHPPQTENTTKLIVIIHRNMCMRSLIDGKGEREKERGRERERESCSSERSECPQSACSSIRLYVISQKTWFSTNNTPFNSHLNWTCVRVCMRAIMFMSCITSAAISPHRHGFVSLPPGQNQQTHSQTELLPRNYAPQT